MSDQATSRIAVRPEVQRTMRFVAFAAGMSQGDMVAVLLELCRQNGEDDFEFGRRIAAEHAARQPARPGA